MFPPTIWSLPNRGHTSRSTKDAWRMPRAMATAFSHPKATAFGVLPCVPEPRVEAIRHVCSTAWRQDAGISPIWRRSRLSYSPSWQSNWVAFPEASGCTDSVRKRAEVRVQNWLYPAAVKLAALNLDTRRDQRPAVPEEIRSAPRFRDRPGDGHPAGNGT